MDHTHTDSDANTDTLNHITDTALTVEWDESN